MNDNISFSYVLGLLLIGAIFGIIGSSFENARGVFYSFATLSAVGVCVVFLIAIIDHRANFLFVLGRASEKVAKLNPDQFQALGLTFPKVRGRWPSGRAELYFDDTNATMEHFKMFMFGADAAQIYPERNCNAELPRWAWQEIRVCLEGYVYVVPDSASGNRSWRWANQNTYANLHSYFGVWIDPVVSELD